MEWGAEQIALAIAGALFLFGVVASLHPRLTLSFTSRIVLSAAAGLYLAAAVAVKASTSPLYVPLVWLVALSVVGVVARDAVGHRTRRLAHAVTSQGRGIGAAHDLPPTAAPAAPQHQGEGEEFSRIARAQDPAASSAELEELAYTLPEARPAVAAHDSTSASVLSWLALHGDDAVVAAIAARHESGDETAIDR